MKFSTNDVCGEFCYWMTLLLRQIAFSRRDGLGGKSRKLNQMFSPLDTSSICILELNKRLLFMRFKSNATTKSDSIKICGKIQMSLSTSRLYSSCILNISELESQFKWPSSTRILFILKFIFHNYYEIVYRSKKKLKKKLKYLIGKKGFLYLDTSTNTDFIEDKSAIYGAPSDKCQWSRILSFFCCFRWEYYEYHGGGMLKCLVLE